MKKLRKRLAPYVAAGCIISMAASPVLSWAKPEAANAAASGAETGTQQNWADDWILDEDLLWNADFYADDEDIEVEDDGTLWLYATSSNATPSDAVPSDTVKNAEETATASNAVTMLKATPSNAEETLEYDESEILENGLDYYDDCSEEHEGAALIESGAPDGSSYYQKTGDNADLCSMDFSTSGTSEFCVWGMDIRFDENGAGFIPKNQSGTKGNLATCVVRKDQGGTPWLAIQTSGSKFSYLTEIDSDVWYRIMLRGYYEAEGSRIDLYLQAFDQEGNLTGEIQKFEDVNKRNNKAPRRLVMNGGTSFDNVRVYNVAPGKVELTAAGDVTEIYSNSSLQFTPAVYTARDEKMPSTTTSVNYQVYRNGEQVVLEAEISETGLLKVLGSTVDQNFTIRAISKLETSVFGEKTLHVKAVAPIVVKKIGFNEDYSRLVSIRADVNQIYDTGIVFIVGIYDENGTMKKSFAKTLEADAMGTGSEVKINVNGEMPSDFDREKDVIKVFVWQK